jgi:hypothetical protein
VVGSQGVRSPLSNKKYMDDTNNNLPKLLNVGDLITYNNAAVEEEHTQLVDYTINLFMQVVRDNPEVIDYASFQIENVLKELAEIKRFS